MQRLDISDIETRGIILSRQRTTKTLIRSVSLLFVYGKNRFSHDMAHIIVNFVHLSRLVIKPTKWLCAQRRLRSDWASAQSDQSLCCALNWYLRTQAFFMRTAKTLIRLDAQISLLGLSRGGSFPLSRLDQTGRMPRLIWVFAGRTDQFVVFVTRRLISIITVAITFFREIVLIKGYSTGLQTYVYSLKSRKSEWPIKYWQLQHLEDS